MTNWLAESNKMTETHVENTIEKLQASHHIRFIYECSPKIMYLKINRSDVVGGS